MKITKFRDIKQFPHCCYHVDVEWGYLEQHIRSAMEDYNLDLNPDFQRAHVWNEDQQIKYCEYILSGGTSGREIYLNCKNWMGGGQEGPYVVVDGKQRIQAVRLFMNNELPVFGSFINEFTDRLRATTARLSWNVAALESKRDILRWYLDFNAGGTPHTDEELNKVKALLSTYKKE